MESKALGAKCNECPLANKPCARTLGPSNSEVILVSRSPGYHESIAGKPFSGPSGKVLDHLLNMNGVKREDIRVTNVVLCAPDQGKVPPDAIKACKPRLDQELSSASLIIAAGSEACNAIIGSGSIDSHRGYRINRNGKTYVATNNPALVLRDDSTFPNLVRDFKRAFNPIPPPEYPTVTLLREENEVNQFITSLINTDRSTPIAVDIETRGGLTHFAKLISIQFSISGNKAVVLGEPGLTSQRSLMALREFLEQDRIFVFHNGKFDVKVLRTSYGINVKLSEDTLLLSYALDERSGGDDMVGVHGLEYLLMEEFGWEPYESYAVHQTKRTGIVTNWQEFAKYAGYDVAGTMQLYTLYRPQVRLNPDLEKSYTQKLIAGAKLTMQMEMHGMRYDIETASDWLELDVRTEIESLIKRMQEISGIASLLPSSPMQMASLFYDEWGITHVMQQRPDKKRSVDESARTEIIEGRYQITKSTTDNSVVVAFVENYDRFQKITKQANTYLKSLIIRAEKNAENRIYTEIVLHGTNSGRPSSRNPNLLNITRSGRHENMPDIRKLFLASPGRLYIQADYKQAELRVIAALSGDKALARIYNEDKDLHNIVAENFYGENYTNENRQTAKNINFGVAFRQSPESFQEKHGIPVTESRPFVEWWWKQFSGVYEWEKQVEIDIRSKGVLTSPYGRKRRFHLLTAENIQGSYREGINFYPQSTASDLTLSSAIIINREIDRNRAALVLYVYDSILSDVQEDYVEDFSTILRQVMESRAKEDLGWDLPFKIDIGVGPNWSEAK